MPGVMTHMLPNVMRAMEPWLKEKITDERYWDGEHDTEHNGTFEIEPMTEDEQKQLMVRFYELPHPFAA